MSGSIQSQKFEPGVSGWKLHDDGTLEINSCTLGSAAKAPERQMVSVEVASWSKYDLPKNADNLLQFMQAELQKVPEHYRHAAEFEEFDASYGDESFNARLFLSYSRLETEEELAERLAKAKVAGTHIKLTNKGLTVSHDGVLRYRIGNLERPEPFKVDEGQTYITDTFLADSTITNAKLANNWSVRVETDADGQKYAAGVGMGMCTGGYTGDGPKHVAGLAVSTEKLVLTEPTDLQAALMNGDAKEILSHLAGKIAETELGKELKDSIDAIGVNKRLDELKEKQGAENRAVAERLDSLATKICGLHILLAKRT